MKEQTENKPAWFCNYETKAQAQKVADNLNRLAAEMRKLHDDQPAHLRESFGYGTMNCGLYDYSAGEALQCSHDVTDEWGGLYRTRLSTTD